MRGRLQRTVRQCHSGAEVTSPSAVETAERALADPRAARDSRNAARSLANLGLART
jgi:hypothetical protein